DFRPLRAMRELRPPLCVDGPAVDEQAHAAIVADAEFPLPGGGDLQTGREVDDAMALPVPLSRTGEVPRPGGAFPAEVIAHPHNRSVNRASTTRKQSRKTPACDIPRGLPGR